MDSTPAGVNPWALGQFPVLIFKINHGIRSIVARIDIEHDDAAHCAGRNTDIGLRMVHPPSADGFLP